MDVHEAIQLSLEYLHTSFEKDEPIENLTLDRSLQYLLCGTVERLQKRLGPHGLSAKDIYMLIEAWILSQGTTSNHRCPLVLVTAPVRP
jgi:hypothetical protein